MNFASLTDPTIANLPYNASGQLVNQNGFGTINAVAPARTLQSRYPNLIVDERGARIGRRTP